MVVAFIVVELISVALVDVTIMGVALFVVALLVASTNVLGLNSVAPRVLVCEISLRGNGNAGLNAIRTISKLTREVILT